MGYGCDTYLYEEDAVLDVRAMHYFAQVAQLGSFSHAARVLRLTQPAVSRQVRKLERELGVPLLYRKGRHTFPTEAGEILLARATELNDAANRAYEDARAGATIPSGPLSIGVSNIIGQLLLPELISRFRKNYPKVSLHISEGYSGFVEEWIAQGRVDVGLIWGKPKSPDIVLDPLLALEMSLVAPPVPVRGCEAAGRPIKECAFEDLVRYPLILPALPHALRLLAERAAEKAKVRMNVVVEVEGLMLAKELVKAGLGYSLMAHAGDPYDVRSKRIRIIRIGPPRVHWVLSVGTRKANRPSVAVTNLIRELVDIAKIKLARHELHGKLVPRGRDS
jgi:LysR family nitrogen assimilation transcriptional regulator